jgi:hypothetical protein
VNFYLLFTRHNLTQIYRYDFCTSWQEQNSYFTGLLWAWKHEVLVLSVEHFLNTIVRGKSAGLCLVFKYVLRSGGCCAIIRGFHMHINWKIRRKVCTWHASFLLVSCKWIIFHRIYHATVCTWCSRITHLLLFAKTWSVLGTWFFTIYKITLSSSFYFVKFNSGIYFCS